MMMTCVKSIIINLVVVSSISSNQARKASIGQRMCHSALSDLHTTTFMFSDFLSLVPAS